MDTIFMNSENCNKSGPHRLLLYTADKINLKLSDKYVALSNHSTQYTFQYTWKNKKSHTKLKNLKYHFRHGMKSLNYLMDHILYQIFKIILNIS